MKLAGSVLVYILCGAALASRKADGQLRFSLVQAGSAESTGHSEAAAQHVYKRKTREDPANPVAAAAMDPNEAAIKIKQKDLIPADRPNLHSEIHAHRHDDRHGDRDDADQTDRADDDDGHSEHKKDSAAKAKAKGSSKAGHNDGDDDDNEKDKGRDKDGEEEERHKEGDDSESHPQKNKDSKGKSKDKDKSLSKQKSKGKSEDNDKKKGKNKKNTHTGLDGSEISDEDEDGGDPKHKKFKVKHVQAKQRRWRTGKPKYNYKKSLAGWKEVGPLYYYKGKYENAAPPTSISNHGTLRILVNSLLAAGLAFAPFA
ncbi:hypothetical protein GGI11_001010 [Coemansia sp. RSA 2049]|nr:hypothetical protein GGI11_001010 [Coemansia sp. RSA 2049]